MENREAALAGHTCRAMLATVIQAAIRHGKSDHILKVLQINNPEKRGELRPPTLPSACGHGQVRDSLETYVALKAVHHNSYIHFSI